MNQRVKFTADSHKKEYWDEKVELKENNIILMTKLRSIFFHFIASCREKIDVIETKEQLDNSMLKVANLLDVQEIVSK